MYINRTIIFVFQKYKKIFFSIKNSGISLIYKYALPFRKNITIIDFFLYMGDLVSWISSDIIYNGYVNTFHGHVVTSDINIIKNNILRFLMGYGTEFKTNRLFKKIFSYDSFLNNLNKFILILSYKYTILSLAFAEWKYQ